MLPHGPPTCKKARPSSPRYIAIPHCYATESSMTSRTPHAAAVGTRTRRAAPGQPNDRPPSPSLLESEGMVYRRPPRGTFVAEPRVRFHIGSFSEEVSRLGMHPDAKLLWAENQEPTATVRRRPRPGRRRDRAHVSPSAHRRRDTVSPGDDLPTRRADTRHPRDRRGRIAVGAPARSVRHRPQPLDRSPGVHRPRRQLQYPARVGPVQPALCSPAAPSTPQADPSNTPATSTAQTERPSKSPKPSQIHQQSHSPPRNGHTR